MLTDDRELELLRDLRGLDVPPSAPARDAARAALLHAVEAERAPARPRRRAALATRPRLFVLSLGAALAAGVPIAIGQLDAKPGSVSTGVLCATEIGREPSGSAVLSDGRPPTQQCAATWPAGRAPAQLTACDSGHDGAVYVYPAGPEVCARLGLQRVTDAVSSADQRFLAFRDAVRSRVHGQCLSVTAARAIVQDELRRAGLAGWTVRADATHQSPPCLSVAFDPIARVVSLHAI